MYRALVALALLLTVQGPGPAVTSPGSGVSCALPVGLSSAWAARNVSITCYPSPGVSCVNGDTIYADPDLGPAANPLYSVSQATSPAFTTNAIGTNPAWNFTSANQQQLLITNAIPISGSIMLAAVLQVQSTGNQPIVSSGSDTLFSQVGSIAWYTNNGASEMDSSYYTNIFTSTVTYAGWSELFFTYNFSSGAYTYGHCSAGTCVSDGSGTTTSTWTNPSYDIGGRPYPNLYFQGPIAEVDYSTTASTSGLGTYFFCQYPTI